MTRLLLAYYGDDFTGSTDVMEVLQWAGLRTVLFLEPPTHERLAGFPGLQAFGVAGWSRTMSPAEMDAELKPAFQSLRDSGAAIVHYKTCSTFDSSAEIGNIGRAMELGRDVFGNHVIPMVVGSPNLGRYQVFGNLFARSGLDTEPFRLDRHPTMRHHPITPMAEADLRSHLAKQTSLRVGLCSVLQLDAARSSDELLNAATGIDALLFDVLTPKHLATIGATLQQMLTQCSPQFAVGSSGIEYALKEHWSRSGSSDTMSSSVECRPTFDATKQLVVMTGSCSPVNDRQLSAAEKDGFQLIALDPAKLIDPAFAEQEISRSVGEAVRFLKQGASVILHSCRGPDDPRVDQARATLRRLGFSDLDVKLKSGRTLGPRLGRILREVLLQHPLERVCVAGGDTSSYVARELGIDALEAVAPLAPGSPLCRVHANGAMNGVEIIFKGGQVGKDNLWASVLNGTR